LHRIVVVGGSLAGHRAACKLRHLGYDGELTVVGAERHRPYNRFPLSKEFLTRRLDRVGLDLDDAPGGITWRLGETATGLDLVNSRIVVDHRTSIPFDGLVVASGARPRDEDVVRGVHGAFVLRTFDDAVAVRALLDGGRRRVVVVGGGLIGAEFAATAARGGHDTTLVDPGEVPTQRSIGLRLARHLLDLHVRAGVDVRSRTRVRGLDVREGEVTGVQLADGSRVPADLVLIATGTTPNVEWLQGNGLGLSGGLHCHATLHAIGPDYVVGAGDVVRAPQALLDDEPLRVETWASTLDQADVAVAGLLSGPASTHPWTALPTFATTIHGARIRVVGYPQVADRGMAIWGSVESGQALVALGRGQRAVAVVSLNAHEQLPGLADQLRPGVGVDTLRAVAGVASTSG
jgi:NADPH-dependent 2,4-dienoyl-CoA reductase/sulfur reductase-like enzyme